MASGYIVSYLMPPEPVPVQMWKKIQERGKIIVGSSPDWPPFEYLDPTGKFVGFEVELVETIASRLGLKVEWRAMEFDSIIPAVLEKKIDLGVSGFSVTPERVKIVKFTTPHSITESQIVMLKSRAQNLNIVKIDSLQELDELDLIVGTGEGTVQEDELKKNAPKVLRSFKDFNTALLEMKNGTIDAVYAETPVTSWWVLEAEKAGEEPIVIVYRKSFWPVAFVAHMDNDLFVTKLNEVFAEMLADGTMDQIKEKWKI
ncbi:MAG: transporter substrate-binding domain-containing protein [Candidatus Aenigmatarchaeota archaeon]